MIVLALIVLVVVGGPLTVMMWQGLRGILEMLLVIVPPLVAVVWLLVRALAIGVAMLAVSVWRLTEHEPIPPRVPEVSWEPLPRARLREGLHPGWRRFGPYLHPGWAKGYHRLRAGLRMLRR